MPRTVLVTGGNRGIGRAIADAFAAAGDDVVVTYRAGEPPDGLAGVRCDVTDTEAVDRAFAEVEQKFGRVDVLVANAGITRDQLLLRMTDDDFTSVLDTNLTGAFRVTKRAVRGMLRSRHGRVVLISSVVGLLGSPGQTNYAASKAGLVGFARSLVRELGPRDITVNVVAPGYVETALTEVLTPERQREIKQQVPLGRTATSEEIAGVVRWLASDEAAYVTGAVIPVDGGLGMGH